MTTLPADELVERLNKRAETYNTGVAVHPESCGTLGYYSSHDADLDRKVAAELSSLRAKLAEAVDVVRALVNAPVWLDADTPDGPEWPAVTPAELIAPLRAARRLIEGNGK